MPASRELEEFLGRIALFAQGITAYLSPNNVCAVLVGDVRRDGRIIPLGARTLDTFLGVGYELQEIVIKTQHHDRSS